MCFSKRESVCSAAFRPYPSQPEADTYYVFAGGKVEGLPVPGVIAEALSYRGRGAGKPKGGGAGKRQEK